MSLATASMTKNASSVSKAQPTWPASTTTAVQLTPLTLSQPRLSGVYNTTTSFDKLSLSIPRLSLASTPASAQLAAQTWPQAWPAAQMPAVDMMVLPCEEAAQNSKQDVVKVSYTSAEDLADALFPTGKTSDFHNELKSHKEDIQDLSNHRELVHEALLDHRDRVTSLLRDVGQLSNHRNLVHDALLDHKSKVTNLHQQVSLVDEGLRDHKKHIQQHARDNSTTLRSLREQGDVLQQLQHDVKCLSSTSKNIQTTHDSAIAHLQKKVSSLSQTSDKMDSALKKHKTFLDQHSEDLNALSSLHEQLQDSHVSSHKKIASLAASITTRDNTTDRRRQQEIETLQQRMDDTETQLNRVSARQRSSTQIEYLERPRVK